MLVTNESNKFVEIKVRNVDVDGWGQARFQLLEF
jgi:hypothetical protein